MTDIREWFVSLPIFTRYWFGLSIVFPIIGRFGFIDPRKFLLSYDLLFKHFQIWRPVTALFFYPVQSGFRFLANLYFLYTYSIRLETGLFDGRPADYGFLLLFCWACITIFALLAEMMLLMDSMVMAVIYIWCQLNQDVVVQFWFGTHFKAMYLPWIVTIFEFVMSGSFISQLIGIFVGHVYFFLKFKYPIDFGGADWLTTPQFMYKYFPNQRGISGFGSAPPRRAQEGGNQHNRGHNWGRGHTLGGN